MKRFWICTMLGAGDSQGLEVGMYVKSLEKPDILGSDWRLATEKEIKEIIKNSTL